MEVTRRRVTVSALGAPGPTHPGPGYSDDVLVARMVDYWRRHLEDVLIDQPDLVVLPELCDRYNGSPIAAVVELRPAMAQAMHQELAGVAQQAGCHIVHAAAWAGNDGRWHNSARLIGRGGEDLGRYDKLRLVPPELDYNLVPGTDPVVLETDFGRVGFAICFDLNFIELIEQYRPLHPDVMIFPSRYHGGLMQRYWAFQLRSHFIGAVGIHNLTSDILSPVAGKVAGSTNYQSWITTMINTNCAVVHLDNNGAGPLAALKKAYGPAVTISDPGELGSVLITAVDVPVDDLLSEFGIERLDDYLERARAVNARAIEQLEEETP